MKSILALILLCIGCASAPPAEPKTAPVCPELPKPVAVAPCSDQLILLDSDALAKGFSCPDNSRTTFPSYYGNSGKVLILCQCKQ